MDDQPPANPPPPPQASSSSRPFAYRAAKLSLWLPFVGIIAGCLVGLYLNGVPDERPNFEPFTPVIISWPIWLTGVVLAIIAFRGMKKHGRPDLFGRALIGILLNGFFLMIATIMLVAVFVIFGHIHQSDQTASEREYQKAKAKVGEGPALDAELVSKAMWVYAWDEREVAKNLSNTWDRLNGPFVLDMAFVTKREDVLSREVDVQDFIDVCRRQQYRVENSAGIVGRELDKHKISPQAREKAVKDFVDTRQPTNAKLILLTRARVRHSESILPILNFLNDNWGKWKYREDRKKVVFEDESLVAKYNDLVHQYDQAAAEISKLMEEIRAIRNPTK